MVLLVGVLGGEIGAGDGRCGWCCWCCCGVAGGVGFVTLFVVGTVGLVSLGTTGPSPHIAARRLFSDVCCFCLVCVCVFARSAFCW